MYVGQVYDLAAAQLRENLNDGPLLTAAEAILHAIKAEERERVSFILLPIWTCQAAGGEARRAAHVSAAWCQLRIAALLLDAAQDEELNSKPWPDVTLAQATNVATTFVLSSWLTLENLARSEAENGWTPPLCQDLCRLLLQVCDGQHLGLAGQPLTLKEYWQMAGGKSGAFFALACRGGALLGTRDSELVDRYARFGYNLGILVQITDDFNDVWNTPGTGDLFSESRSLPVVYALSVGSPETQEHLRELLDRVPVEESARAEARQMLVDLGVLEYLVLQMELYRYRAQKALPEPRDIQAHDQLLGLLNRVTRALRSAG